MIEKEIKEKLINFYGGNKAAVIKGMRFEERNGRVVGRYTASNNGYFYQGEVSCLSDGTGMKWDVHHHYEREDC